MERLLVLGMLASCGRIGFDASASGNDGGSDAAPSAYAAAALADRPVGYWRFGDLARIVDEIGGPDGTAVGGCSAAAGNLVDDPDGADGVEAGVSNVDANLAPAVATRLEVGAARRADGEHQSFFDGAIDEVAIYDYSLTPAQLLRHWQIGSGGP